MTQAQVVAELAKLTGLNKKDTKRLMENLTHLVIEETKRVGICIIPGIGRLVRSDRKARFGRNPATGELMKIPAKTVVKFRLSKSAQDAIVSQKAATKKAASKKAATKKAASKKAPTKKAAPKKPATKKAASKKPATKKAASKKPATKKAAPKKAATKKAAPKKAATKKAAPKKAATKPAPAQSVAGKKGMPISIFINYRRLDSAHARSVYQGILPRFGKNHVFMDIDRIEPGEDFLKAIEKVVESCDVLIVLIGKGWLSQIERLKGPADVVRLEIAAALNRDIRVIPVLVDDAKLPTEEALPEDLAGLTRRQALPIPDSYFEEGMNRLVETLEKIKRRSR